MQEKKFTKNVSLNFMASFDSYLCIPFAPDKKFCCSNRLFSALPPPFYSEPPVKTKSKEWKEKIRRKNIKYSISTGSTFKAPKIVKQSQLIASVWCNGLQFVYF